MAQRKRSGSETNFEDSLQKLEAIVKRLEEEEISLETSLKLFAEGQSLARACEEQLKGAENQIRQLLEKNSGEIKETEFHEEASNPSETEPETEEDEESGDAEDPPSAQHKSGPRDPEKPRALNVDELPF